MSADYCVLCGELVPEGRQVCPRCVERVEEQGCPPEFIAEHEITRLSGLRGRQVKSLIRDYGAEIGKCGIMRFTLFKQLKSAGLLERYKLYSATPGKRPR